MKHPILSGSGYKFYLLVWLVIMIVHGLVLYFLYDLSIAISISDSLIYNGIFGAIVPGFWFIVIFGGLNKDSISLMITHLGAAAISILVWLGASGMILKILFAEDQNYVQFLQEVTIWRVIIGTLFYSISVLLFYLIRYYQDMQKRMNRELELQNLLKDSELRMLKSQINPHFIFNSLNSVSALTVSNPKNARQMVIKLSDFLRYSLGKGNEELTSLKEEVKNLSIYLDIEKVRFGDKLIFEKDIDPIAEDIQLPNLILQPLIENAIKHGVYDSLETVKINLVCTLGDQFLKINLKNNFDKKMSSSKGEGIGLENVRKRLSLVYGKKDLLKVTKDSNTFEVQVRIPIEESGDG